MKFYLFFILISANIVTHAQLPFLEVKQRIPDKSTAVKYDGSSNFKVQEKLIDYNQYIGLDVIVTKGSESLNKTLKSTEVFKISSIKVEANSGNLNYDGGWVNISMSLKSTRNEETLTYFTSFPGVGIYDEEGHDDFILLDHFNYLYKSFNDAKYVCVNTHGKFLDLSTGKEMLFDKPLYGGDWVCKVGFSGYDENDKILLGYNSSNDNTTEKEKLTFIYKNAEGNVIVDPKIVSSLFKVGNSDSKSFQGYEYYGDNYSRNMSEIFLLEKRIYDQQVNIELDRQKKETELVKKYGSANYKLISSNTVKIGFNKEMCRQSWGTENYKVISKNEIGDEVWQHKTRGVKLCFKKGILSKID